MINIFIKIIISKQFFHILTKKSLKGKLRNKDNFFEIKILHIISDVRK